jgi:hypothetical protein
LKSAVTFAVLSYKAQHKYLSICISPLVGFEFFHISILRRIAAARNSAKG